MADGGGLVGEETAIDVCFGSGEELLNSYWGYLTGGGLIIADPGLEVGSGLSMRVKIDSSDTHYRLRGTIVKREPDTDKAIIAFRSGEAHDMLLSEALADTENVAPRRFARFEVEQPVQAVSGETRSTATLLNLSREGGCLLLPESARGSMGIDSEVELQHGEIHALATVVWSRNLERGLRLSADEAEPLLAALVPDLC